jgi:putative DNA primase/helicase
MKLRETDNKTQKLDFHWPAGNDDAGHFRIKKSYGSDGYKRVIPWVVKNMIPASSVGLIFGRSQSFKTFFIIDKCCRVATGLDYGGNPTKQGLVYLVAAEGDAGIAKRIRAWELINKRTVGNNLVVVPHTVFPTTDYQL